jgi:hypothetical protein
VARDSDVRIAVLSADPLGYRLYKNLGFEIACRHLTYVWKPSRQSRFPYEVAALP